MFLHIKITSGFLNAVPHDHVVKTSCMYEYYTPFAVRSSKYSISQI